MQLFGSKTHLKTRDQIIEGCRKGDRRAQKELYDSLAPKMYAVCLRYMGDSESAKDILQDGFVTLFTKIDSYSAEGSFEGWARKIFVNTALMSLRKHNVLRDSEDVEAAWNISSEDVSPLESISQRELLELVSQLPPGFRTVFNMYIVEGYSHKEIAEILGVSEATSRSQLQRARAVLQGKIKDRH